MLQYFLNDISVLYTGNDLHVAATFIALLYFNTKDSLQSLGPEKNSASSNKPCPWRMAKPLATHLLAFSVPHAFLTCFVAEGRPEIKHHESGSGLLAASAPMPPNGL
jgi:hypothetical protein